MVALPYLGIAGIGLSLCAVVVRYLEERFKKLSHKEAMESGKQYFVDKIRTPLLAFVGVLILCGFAVGPYQLYSGSRDELGLSNSSVRTLIDERDKARAALEARKHNLRSGDVAFDNMLGVINASLLLRHSIGDDASCQIKITAPDENHPVASVVAQLASTASRCAVIGPDFLKLIPPEMEQQATKGMLADVVLLHMPKGFKNEVAIEDAMRSILRVKRAYGVPAGSPPNTIWLQFGTGKQWNSQS